MPRYSLKERHKAGWIKLAIICLALVVIVFGGAVAVVYRLYNDNLKPVSANQKKVLVQIPIGASVKDIAHLLQQNGVIRSAWAFEQYVRFENAEKDLKAGTYSLQASQSVPDIVKVLTQGKILTDLVTITPGQRIDQVRDTLVNYGFNRDEVTEALKPSSYPDHPIVKELPKGVTLEGYIYPESFLKTADTTPKELIKKHLDEMQKNLTPNIRKGIEEQGLTLRQGIILASIIEQEVSNEVDRSKVAQVFLKRLKEDIALASDATAPYGAIINNAPPSLTYDSPYNTYKYPGLPPGPISNVSKSSLEAVANPATTDWLYFVSGDDGITYFSKTLQEHEALTAKHCKKLCS
jgi:UPF0755 protein